MKDIIKGKLGQITFVTSQGKDDDIAKAKFKKGDIVVILDDHKNESNSFNRIAIVDVPFISLYNGELQYAVIVGYKDNGRETIRFCAESQLRVVKESGIDEST